MTSRRLPLLWDEQEWLTWPSDKDILVSEYGVILSAKRYRKSMPWYELPQSFTNYGYLQVRVSGHNTILVHRLVAQTWVYNANPSNFVVVNHLNGDKLDNHKSNLEWTTQSQNVRHSYTIGLQNGKTSNQISIQVLETGEIFKSQLEASLSLGICDATISKYFQGKVQHVNGYHFRRINNE